MLVGFKEHRFINVKIFIINAAYSDFEEKGLLEEGKLANIVILSCNPYDVPTEQIYERIKVEYVFVAGKPYNPINTQ